MNKHRYPCGSEWRKWDLHAHTPLDPEWIACPPLQSDAQKRLFAEQYVEAAVAAQLAVVAITDHNFCNNRDELLIPYIQKAALPHDLTILPGFEVTVSDCGGTHLLVIFSEESSLATIDEVVCQLFPPGTSRFQGHDVLPSNRGIEELNEILAQSTLDYLILFAHADRDNGVLWHRGSALRSQLWKQPFVRIAQLSKPPSECTGFIASVINGTNSHYVRDITYVTASDCRSLESAVGNSERCPLGGRYTWIKADPTFEGLRQIVFEPDSRTSFQEHKPEQKPAFLTINEVRFIDPSGKFQPDSIRLNPNLTTIIGGKSNGKSLLLSCIAQAIDSRHAQAAVGIARTNLYNLDGLDFEVTWSTGDIDRLSEHPAQHHVTFLPQMYIHRLVEEENRPSLSDSLLKFLRQNELFEVSYQGLIVERDATMRQLATEVSSFFSHLSSWYDIAAKIQELGDRGAIESEIGKIAERTEALRKASGFNEQETKDYERLQQALSDSSERLKVAQRIEACMKDISTNVPGIILDSIGKLDEVVSEAIATHDLDEAEQKLVLPVVTKLKQEIKTAHTSFAKKTATDAVELSKTTKKAASDVESAKSALKPFWDKIANQKELKELQELTKKLTLALKAIRLKEKEKTQIEQKYWASLEAIKKLVAARYEIQERLICLFNDAAYTQIDPDTIISVDLTFEKERFNSDFIGLFDLRYPLTRLGNHFRNNTVSWSPEKHVAIITDMLDKLVAPEESELKLRSGQTRRNAVEMLLRDYLSHSFTVKQSGEDIFEMSPGKQGLILLEIFLHLSNSQYPILIDQPEDNLDNRTIYSHLVNYIRTRKLKRQIIMVTHNPNLVLGTDAEQIVVANQDGQGQGKNAKYRFEYVSGAIECSFTDAEAACILDSQGIRQHVCHVLEGGEEAFRKREEKYCLA